MIHLKILLILNILFLKLVNADDFDSDRYFGVSSIVIIYFIILIFVICCAVSCCHQEESVYQNIPYPQQSNQTGHDQQIGHNQNGFVNHAYAPNLVHPNQMNFNQPIYSQSLPFNQQQLNHQLLNQQALNQLPPPPYQPNINHQPVYNQAYHEPQFNRNQRY